MAYTVKPHAKRMSSTVSRKRSPRNYAFNEVAETMPVQHGITGAVIPQVPTVSNLNSKQRRSLRRMAAYIERKQRESN